MMSDAVKNRSMKAQYDASCASKVFGMQIKPDAESLLNSSLTYSPSPTAEKETIERIMGNKLASIPSIAFTFDSTEDQDPLLLTDRFKSFGDRVKSNETLERKTDSKRQQTAANRNEQIKAKDSNNTIEKRNNFGKDELLRRMQQAVFSASKSVNDTLNAVRKAKQAAEQEKILQNQKFREAHRTETEEVAAFQAEAERQRRELLALKTQELHKFQKAKVEREQAAHQERMNAAMKESLFKSEVFRAHKNDLKEAEERRKRMSIDVRTKIRAENRLGMAKIETARLEEEQAIINERYERSIAIQQARSMEAETRRKSLVFRNGDARRIRALHAQIQKTQQLEQHQSYELKWAAEKDAEECKKQCEQDRRDSFAFRNQEGRKIREFEERVRSEQLSADHGSYELKWAAEKDAEEYKRRCDQERRESFAFRNQEGRKHREFEERIRSEKLSADHESYELTWAAEKDMEEYKRKCEQDRRDSFAFRNQQGRKARELEQQQRSEKLSAEHESFELKWAAEKDAEEHKKQCEQDRRDSFAFRNQEGRKIREFEERMRSEQFSADHESYELKWAAEKDAEEYKRLCDQERRESFAFRNQEGRKHREFEERIRSEELSADHESYELKWAAERDAKQFLKKCEDERRLSLQWRGQEAARHRAVMDELRSIMAQKEHESIVLKWAAEDDVKEYLEQCAAQERTALVFRAKEARLIRLKEQELQSRELEKMKESFELEAAAGRDVQDYVEKCKNRDRLSLAFRAKEKRRHAEWEKEKSRMEIEGRNREINFRALDARYVKLAQERERAMKAIEAIRHAGRNFASNPFASLLD
jgi:hypothetical protein